MGWDGERTRRVGYNDMDACVVEWLNIGAGTVLVRRLNCEEEDSNKGGTFRSFLFFLA